MSRRLLHSLPFLAALAMSGGIVTTASAQTAPPQDQQRAGVRQILNQAEAESRRRTLGDVLGGLAGISQAAAQTAPQAGAQGRDAPPRSAAPNNGSATATASTGTPGTPTARASPRSTRLSQAPAASPAPTAVPTTPSANATPAARTSPSGNGTASDPAMIATVPQLNGAPPAPVAQDQGNDAPQGAVTQDAAPVAGPSVAPAAETRTVIAESAPNHRTFGHRHRRSYGEAPVWCPPPRW